MISPCGQSGIPHNHPQNHHQWVLSNDTQMVILLVGLPLYT